MSPPPGTVSQAWPVEVYQVYLWVHLNVFPIENAFVLEEIHQNTHTHTEEMCVSEREAGRVGGTLFSVTLSCLGVAFTLSDCGKHCFVCVCVCLCLEACSHQHVLTCSAALWLQEHPHALRHFCSVNVWLSSVTSSRLNLWPPVWADPFNNR